TPTILATIIGASIAHPRNVAELIQSDILATKSAAFIDVLLIVGIAFAVLLADRVGRIRLQILGFIGCAVGLLLAALSLHLGGTLSGVLLFAGFMLFSFMTNIGPNAMTYLIAGEVFPTSIRGTGWVLRPRSPRSARCSPRSCSRSCSRTSAPICCC